MASQDPLDKYPSGTYHGSFSSDNTGYSNIVCGNIQTLLDLKTNTAKFRLSYTGVYKHGKVHTFTAIIVRNSGTTNFDVIPDIKTEQKMTFTINKYQPQELKVSGSYTSNKPDDKGSWNLIKADFDYNKPPDANQGGCSIM